jgi:hypothetical protein
VFLIIISVPFTVTPLSVCTPWFHNTVTSSCSHTGLGVCVCVYHLSFRCYYYYYYHYYYNRHFAVSIARCRERERQTCCVTMVRVILIWYYWAGLFWHRTDNPFNICRSDCTLHCLRRAIEALCNKRC